MLKRGMAFLSTFAAALLGCADASDAGEGSGGSQRSASSGDGAGGALGGEVCPWQGDDPGDLIATGSAVGDVIANVQGLVDQCGVTRSLWDFAGGYRIVVLAEGW